MNTTQVDQLLAQMRSTASRLQETGSLPRPAVERASETEAPGFGDLLADSIASVSATQKSGAAMAAAFERGESGQNLNEVMIQLQKADLSFRAMSEVRNKLVRAYQDIMNMPV